MRSFITRVCTTAAAVAIIGGGSLATASVAQAAPVEAPADTTAASDVARVAGQPDYCGPAIAPWIPDRVAAADFGPACAAHDQCYSSRSTASRQTCDNFFRADLLKACSVAYPNPGVQRSGCNGVAQTYYLGVRAFGAPFYNGTGANN